MSGPEPSVCLPGSLIQSLVTLFSLSMWLPICCFHNPILNHPQKILIACNIIDTPAYSHWNVSAEIDTQTHTHMYFSPKEISNRIKGPEETFNLAPKCGTAGKEQKGEQGLHSLACPQSMPSSAKDPLTWPRSKWSRERCLHLPRMEAYSLVVQSLSHVWLCDPKDCSILGSSVFHCLLEFAPLNQWCYLTTSSSAALLSSWPRSFPASGSFPVSQLFSSGGQSTGTSASASVLPMSIQSWFL